MSPPAGQLSLFPDDDESVFSGRTTAAMRVDPLIEALAHRVRTACPTLRMGTSSWTFPGWTGLVYAPTRRDGGCGRPSEPLLRRDGLRAYAEHPLLRTVGVDRSFYAPLSVDAWTEYAAATPPDFRFLVKADRALTSSTERDGAANPLYLNAEHAIARVLAPTVGGLGARLGVFLLQFPPLRLGVLGGASGFLAGLAPFLRRIDAWRREHAAPLVLAIELRNEEPYAARHIGQLRDALADADACVVHCHHPAAPPLAVQSELFPPSAQSETIVRWMLRRNHRYEEAADSYRPFDRLVEPDPQTRREIARLVRDAQALRKPVWVIVNNKAEGCSPMTISELAEHIAGMTERA